MSAIFSEGFYATHTRGFSVPGTDMESLMGATLQGNSKLCSFTAITMHSLTAFSMPANQTHAQVLSSEQSELCHRGGGGENQTEQRGAGGGGAGPSKYQELGESGMFKEKDVARRHNTTKDLSVVLGHGHMEPPAEGSLDAAEQDRLLEGREGRRAGRKEEESNVSDCVAAQ